MGEALALSASAPNYTSVQWFKDGVEIPGATNASYSKENVTLEDAGKYKAVFQTPEGVVETREATVTVKVNVVPVTSVTVSPKVKIVKAGEKVNLTAKVLPDNATNKKVTWKTSDKSLATVTASGVVTAIADGTAIITATSDNGKSDTHTLTIDSSILPESIKIDASSAELEIGGSKTLTVTFTPDNVTDKTLNWMSTYPDIVKVEDGVITGLKAGSATINVMTVNNKTASCKVTVKPKVEDTIDIEGSGTTQYLKKGSSKTLKVTTTPEDAVWSIDDSYDKTVVEAKKV